MKIFISIASYQDPLLETTIRGAFDNADEPDNLFFGICDQSSHALDVKIFSFSNKISYEDNSYDHLSYLGLDVYCSLESQYFHFHFLL